MATVLLGNPNPQMQVLRSLRDPDDNPIVDAEGRPVTEQVSVPAPHLNQSVTRVDMRENWDDPAEVDRALSTSNDRLLTMIARGLAASDKHLAIGLLELEGIVDAHTAGGKPTWVSCPDDPDFERVIAEHFDCPIGEPTALITNQGRDALHNQHTTTGAQPAAVNYMSLSANTAAESAANTSLPGEITTAGGGLIRKQATVAHTAGTNTTTLSATFTANGSDTLPVTVAKIGAHNAASGVGNLDYEKLLSQTATLSASGDNVAITYTLTIG